MQLFTDLKAKQRKLREGFPEALGPRVHRALRSSLYPDFTKVRFVRPPRLFCLLEDPFRSAIRLDDPPKEGAVQVRLGRLR